MIVSNKSKHDLEARTYQGCISEVLSQQRILDLITSRHLLSSTSVLLWKERRRRIRPTASKQSTLHRETPTSCHFLIGTSLLSPSIINPLFTCISLNFSDYFNINLFLLSVSTSLHNLFLQFPSSFLTTTSSSIEFVIHHRSTIHHGRSSHSPAVFTEA